MKKQVEYRLESTLSSNSPVSAPLRTVREATFDVFKQLGLNKIFSNPGSTEVPLLRDFPKEFQFVLGLHEASVVGMATGYALATKCPALALLHTTAGLGNAVGAIATARVNKAPLVLIVGQQDRRHLINKPFLTGDLEGLAGGYPVWIDQPALAKDVPSLIFRAWNEANFRKGPALVMVPMNDWSEQTDDIGIATVSKILISQRASENGIQQLADLVNSSKSPGLVVGADSDSAEVWNYLIPLAEKLEIPVWQEAFGSRAGFPQTHRLFQGHLPSGRSKLRNVLSKYDFILTIGAPVFRQYPYEPGSFVDEKTRIALISETTDVATISAAELAVIGPIADICESLIDKVAPRIPFRGSVIRLPRLNKDSTARLRPGNVFDAIAERITPETLIIEESPSSRLELMNRIPVQRPFGFLSAAMGGLGFAMPAAIGVGLAEPERPIIAIVGDGSAMYSFQSIWSAVQYHVGVLFVIMNNGSYSIMDRLAEMNNYQSKVWPSLSSIDVTKLASGFGCDTCKVTNMAELDVILDKVVPQLGKSDLPILIDVSVETDPVFES